MSTQPQSAELGSVTATIAALVSTAGTVLPAILGGKKSAAERQRELLIRKRKLQRIQDSIERDIAQRRQALVSSIDVQQARKIIDTNAVRAKNEAFREYFAQYNGVVGSGTATTAADLAAERVREMYLKTASSTIFRAQLPTIVAAGAGTAAAGWGAYTIWKNRDSLTSS